MTLFVFFFNDTATTEIYTLSLHDALPIWQVHALQPFDRHAPRHRHQRAGNHSRPHLRQGGRSEEHTSELQSQSNLVCRLLLEKKKKHTQEYTGVHHIGTPESILLQQQSRV